VNNNLEVQPQKIPQNRIGRVIEVNLAPYVIPPGATVVVAFRQTAGAKNVVQTPASGSWVYTSGQSTATYTTVGGEFGAVPGLCDAQVMVYASGLLDYSYIFPQFIYFEPPMITPPA
jgi:hypothetical protein